MVNRLMVGGALGCVLAALPLAASAAGMQKDQNAKNAALDNSCAATEGSGVVGRTTKKATGWLTKLKKGSDLPAELPISMGDSPICNAQSQEERLLLTGLMMDRTALSAAKGVDFAQVALRRKRTLEARIAELERTVNGLGSGNPTATEVLLTEASRESDELAKALDALVKDNALDDIAKEHLGNAQRSLNEVKYYSISAAAGGKLFTGYMASNPSTTKLFAVLNSPRIGLGSEFAKTLPKRATEVPLIAANTSKLRTSIGTAKLPLETPEEGQKRARQQANEDAKRIQDALKDSGMATTPVQTGPQESAGTAH